MLTELGIVLIEFANNIRESLEHLTDNTFQSIPVALEQIRNSATEHRQEQL